MRVVVISINKMNGISVRSMTSSSHGRNCSVHTDWSRNVSWKFTKLSKYHNFLIFQPIFIRFSPNCSVNFTSDLLKLSYYQLRTWSIRLLLIYTGTAGIRSAFWSAAFIDPQYLNMHWDIVAFIHPQVYRIQWSRECTISSLIGFFYIHFIMKWKFIKYHVQVHLKRVASCSHQLYLSSKDHSRVIVLYTKMVSLGSS